MKKVNQTETTTPLSPVVKRRALLPWWIKAFCWIFMLFAAASAIDWAVRAAIGETPYVNLFASPNTVELISPWGIPLALLVIYKGYVGYALWSERDSAVTLGNWMPPLAYWPVWWSWPCPCSGMRSYSSGWRSYCSSPTTSS